ncbi:permease for cytosine/purines, uracil, thiamine, allantoin-domain-containing protein [Mrakia frigida]|uniref:nucleobase cation symporter-1 family protein n=1 Tax=Mrakia frigida TaxID=29902 RepID=UPI003FCC0495
MTSNGLTIRNCTKLSSWELAPEESSYARIGTSNKDLDPTPPSQRTWTTSSFVVYWISDALNISTWMMASAMLAGGMSLRYALPCIFLGHFIIAIPILLQSATGAILHVPFPIQARSSFGFHLSKFAVISRVVLAVFWTGVQCYTGSECVHQMIIAFAPSFRNFPNHLPESANITSAGMLSFFLFWLIQFPFVLIHPTKIKYFFWAKSIFVPIVFVALFIWALAAAGTGPIFQEKTTISGSKLAWTFLSSMNSVLGNYATLSVNIPDFSRYAKNTRAIYIQGFIIPVVFTLTAFVGIVVTSAGEALYGKLLWDPTTLVNEFNDDAKGRAARFFCAFGFALATIGTNVSANTISAANDLLSLFPRYMNIRRGSIFAVVVGGWCITPWNILAKAGNFLAFMGGYTVFLAPLCGIMVADYWITRRGRIDVPALYTGMEGRYRYIGGVNWRALVALVVPIAPTLPGLAASVSPGTVTITEGLTNLFSICWLFGFCTSIVIYSGLSHYFPDSESFVPHAILADDVPDLPTSGSDTLTKEGTAHGAEAGSIDEDEKAVYSKDATKVRVEAI